MANAHLSMGNTRLEYVVVPLEGKVTRVQHKMVQTKKPTLHSRAQHKMERVEVEQEAGYLVYYPQGHVLRFKDMNALRKHGLDVPPRIINAENILGDLMAATSDEKREFAMLSLQEQLVKLATRRTGNNLLTRSYTVDDLERDMAA